MKEREPSLYGVQGKPPIYDGASKVECLARSVYSLAIKNTISLTVSYNFIYYLIVEIRMCLTCENRDSLLNFFLDFFKIWTNKNTGSQNLKDIYKTVR